MKADKLILGLAVIACACNRDTVREGEGYLAISPLEDKSTVEVSTKAVDAASSPFILKIYEGKELMQTVDDHRTLFDNPLILNCATYTVQAYNREENEAIMDSPRYFGEATVKINNNETSNTDIICQLSDVLVSPSFSDELKAAFTDYSLEVSNGKGNLVWSEKEGTLGKTGYFKVSDSLIWTLSLTNKAGRKFSKSDKYTGLKARQHYVLDFKATTTDPESGAAGPIKIILDDGMTERSFDLLLDFTTTDAEVNGADVWAAYADITGIFKNETVPEGFGLEYKKTADDSWTAFDGEIKTDTKAKSFSARITGLESSTAYVVRAKTAEGKGKREYSFTTETAEVLHNMSFDAWYTDGSSPMPNASAGYKVWDSANPGSASFGVVPTNPEASHLAVTGTGKKAAKLESMNAPLVNFAAGNIYTGQFGGTIMSLSNPGAKLNWGVPFRSRPLALKGYFDYRPVAINQTDGSHEYLRDKPDTCQIQIFLTDWKSQFEINTAEKRFVNVNDKSIIAYGKIESGTLTSTKTGLVNGYEPFTIKLEYRDKTRKPTMIVIVASASKYGDYFTGGKNSILYLDEFEFVYDPSELSIQND